MAAIDTNRHIVAPANLEIAAFVQGVVGRFMTWNEARKTRKALAQLSDRELFDIGLSRGDIDAIM